MKYLFLSIPILIILGLVWLSGYATAWKEADKIIDESNEYDRESLGAN